MRKCIKMEMKKALWNKTAIMTCAAMTILGIIHGIKAIEAFNDFVAVLRAGQMSGNPMITSMSLFCRWMGADVVSFESSAFYFLFPIGAVLPYGWSMAGELRSGYTKNILCRISRKKYFLSKYCASFTAAALTVIIPLAVNLFVLSLFLPALKMEVIYPYGILGQRSMWSGIYYEAPFLYAFLYICINGIFAGLMAAISTGAAMFIKQRVTVMVLPFFIMLMADYIDSSMVSGWELSPMKFLHVLPVANDRSGIWIFIVGAFLLAVTLGTLIYKGVNYEAL